MKLDCGQHKVPLSPSIHTQSEGQTFLLRRMGVHAHSDPRMLYMIQVPKHTSAAAYTVLHPIGKVEIPCHLLATYKPQRNVPHTDGKSHAYMHGMLAPLCGRLKNRFDPPCAL